MTPFLVLSRFEDNHAIVEARIKEVFPDDHFTVDAEDGLWLVSAKGTARMVYEKLIPNEESLLRTPAGVLIFRINSYWGLGSPEMWEWVATVSKKGEAAGA